jgi:hypothetical protein
MSTSAAARSRRADRGACFGPADLDRGFQLAAMQQETRWML